jgi:glycosyltransferase involved in cell wall biosynthesis
MSPLKIAQYLSYGKAIVASEVPAHRELMRDAETARLVDPADVDAWVRAIRLLLDNDALRETMGGAGRAFYDAELTPDRRVKTVLAGL